MKKGIHPEMRLIEVTDADGNTWKVLSTLSKHNKVTINSSHTIHPAWSGVQNIVTNNKKADKLNSIFD